MHNKQNFLEHAIYIQVFPGLRSFIGTILGPFEAVMPPWRGENDVYNAFFRHVYFLS